MFRLIRRSSPAASRSNGVRSISRGARGALVAQFGQGEPG